MRPDSPGCHGASEVQEAFPMTLIRPPFVRVVLLTMLAALFFGGSTFAAGQKEWLVHSFDGTHGDQPMGSLIADRAGNLYGTSLEGGATGRGVVYELVRPIPPKTAWTETLLYSFGGPPDGGLPEAGLVFDGAGDLYGTTSEGGASDVGTVFELVPPATTGGAWTESILHSFQGGTSDGASPQAGLAFDSRGNLYGVTFAGGANEDGSCGGRVYRGCGTVFQLSPPATSGGAWTETILHSFNYGQGRFPTGTPTLDARGDLYGSAQGGGLYGAGVVYRLTPPATAGAPWTFRVLHAFGPMRIGSSEGGLPTGGLTLHGKMVLYGTTLEGGLHGSGTVFELVPPATAGGTWSENILYSFGSVNNDGSKPAANVIFDSAGNMYGTTTWGGGICAGTCGTVFQLTPPISSGSDWTETILHSFPSTNKDGYYPSGGLLLGKNGALFGATQSGGNNGTSGVVFGATN